MKNAILKAIEGGYIFFRGITNDEYTEYHYNQMLLDPIFWKCLAKGIGLMDCKIHSDYGKTVKCNDITHHGWHITWHSFIDHLAEGGNPDDFFNNLIQ